MTDAPKIETQAPTLNIAFGRDNSELPQGWTLHLGDGVVHYREGNSASSYSLEQGLRAYLAVLADHADARVAAAAMAMREAAIASAKDLPISEIAVDEVVYALEQLPAPDPAALDRLIADRVREAVEAEREACRQISDEYAAENFRMATDSVLLDRMQGFRDTEERQTEGNGHSAAGITARNIAAAIAARSESDSHNNSKVVE